jgi:hypothetical protein
MIGFCSNCGQEFVSGDPFGFLLHSLKEPLCYGAVLLDESNGNRMSKLFSLEEIVQH